MSSGLPNESSVFEYRALGEIYQEICDVYQRYPQPWVVGYSGGKDSTATLQLVWKAIESLPVQNRKKPIFVIASDTGVETPIIAEYLDRTLELIRRTAIEMELPFQAVKVAPALNDSFWVNLLGRGYPAPTARFRWCTERMKINPVNYFVRDKVTEYGEVVMVLGIRESESATRMQLMNTYQVGGHVLRRHAYLSGAYIYAPIAEFSTDDVWTYLLGVSSPWGSENRDLAALYRSATSDAECPLVIDTSTPPCGRSRFGCWVCTVAQSDSSMEAMVDHGEEWMEPLLEFREQLARSTDPRYKREFRGIRGRDGRVVFKKNGELAARTYDLEISRQMLEKLLLIQKQMRQESPYSNIALITEEELFEIRRIWQTERQDLADSVPEIFRRVNEYDLEWLVNDDGRFDAAQQVLLSSICQEHSVPFELVAKLLETERRFQGMARRAGIHQTITSVLAEEWRSEQEILAEGPRQLSYLETLGS